MTEKVGKIEVVIKGGQPWGFRLQANSENRSTLTIIEIFPGGKADCQGELKVGDNVIKINGIQCLSLEDALQLIDSAFRTLTVLVWRPSQCSEDVNFSNNKALEPCFQKLREVSSSTESYPTSFHIYENLLDISQGIVQNSTKPCCTQFNNANCKDNMLTLVPNAGNSTDVRKLKSTSDYVPQRLLSSNLYLKPNFDSKCKRKSYYTSDEKWNCLSLSKVTHDTSSLSSKNFPSNLKGNCHNSYKENYVPTGHQEKGCTSQRSLHKHFLGGLQKNNLNRKVSTETQGCLYPNCQNQYQVCKVHSPPERDIVNPICIPYKGPGRNQLASESSSQFPLKYDEIKYENVELLNSSRENIDVNNIKIASWVNEHSVSKIPLSPNRSDMKLKEKISSNPAHSSCLSSNNLKDISTSDNFPKIINYENVTNKDIPSLLPTRTSIRAAHQDQSFQEPNFVSSESQVKGLINNSLYMFFNKSSMNSSTVPNSNEAFPGYDQNNLDEELIEIEKKFQNTLQLSDCRTPPLPSPPPELETEILETDEPLPPPPSFSSDVNVHQSVQKDTKIVQTIYANLEMLKIQCSVVSSATQTTLQLKNHPVKDFSDLQLELPVEKVPQFKEDPLPETQLGNNKETKSLQMQFHNCSTVKTVQNQEKKLGQNILSLPITSAYFTTSVPKAKLLTQYTSKFEHKNLTFVKELSNEKEELLDSIAKKLRILKQEKAALQEELKQNEELGNSLANKLEKLATKSETQKFKLHVGELEKITNLLLSLSGRLARTENALLILPPESSEEKELLEAKYYKLTQQYDEAVHLQRNIEKRNNQVSLFLYKYLTEDELVDYDHFIHMKVKLLVDYKDLLEKIKLGEEQLYALKSSFNTNGNEIKTDMCNNIYVF